MSQKQKTTASQISDKPMTHPTELTESQLDVVCGGGLRKIEWREHQRHDVFGLKLKLVA